MTKRKEYAIIACKIDDAPTDAETVFKAQDPQTIIDKLQEMSDAGENMEEYTVEEYAVDAAGEFLEGSDFDTFGSFKNRFRYWYAVLIDAEDTDWGTGSYNRAEAVKMAGMYPEGRVAMIDMSGDPICIKIIE